MISDEEPNEFQAMAQGATDYTVAVEELYIPNRGPVMAIFATEEVIYITREQARKFFNFA